MSEPMKPMEIEQRSFAIITELLGEKVLAPDNSSTFCTAGNRLE